MFQIEQNILIKYLGTKENVELPIGIKGIAKEAFLNNSYIKKLWIPDGVEFICENAFKGCFKLKELRIANTLKAFKFSAFLGCKNICIVKLPIKLKKYKDKMFPDSLNTQFIYFELNNGKENIIGQENREEKTRAIGDHIIRQREIDEYNKKESQRIKIRGIEEDMKTEYQMTEFVHLKPGDRLDNSRISSFFCCMAQSGIRLSRKYNALVLLKNRNGIYNDIWKNGICYFVGMGQIGDQDFSIRQNRRLYWSRQNNTKLYLFEEDLKGKFEYVGRVVLAEKPYYGEQIDKNKNKRKVCIFPLRLKESENDKGF